MDLFSETWQYLLDADNWTGAEGLVARLLEQLLLTVLGATAGVMAVLLLGIPGGPVVSGGTALFQLIGYFLLVISTVLVLRVLVLIFRPDR